MAPTREGFGAWLMAWLRPAFTLANIGGGSLYRAWPRSALGYPKFGGTAS